VESGDIQFIPQNTENTYYAWMRNIQDWCISRQQWWGHRIPAWYDAAGNVYVGRSEAEARSKHGLAADLILSQDDDVLDTWFSSALWTFSTLGWPENTPALKTFHSTDLMVTGHDIITFWVSRMIMMSLKFTDQVPFRKVYIHGLVTDADGQKMSKSKGNIIDPLKLIDAYGADALRFTLTAQAAQGRDVKLSESRVEGYRNFCTKIWNAARFCQMNECTPVVGFDPASVTQPINRWVIGKLKEASDSTEKAVKSYRYNDIADVLYHFTWGTFCDWYLELSKPILQGDDGAAKIETRATAAWVLDQILHLLHPVMPFMTEELWQQLGDNRPYKLIQGQWPDLDAGLIDEAVNQEIDWLVRLITSIRAVRSEMNVPAGATIPLLYKGAGERTLKNLDQHMDLLMRLARIESVEATDSIAKSDVQIVVDEATFVMPLADVIDISAEQARLEKEIAKIDAEIDKSDKKLGNESFIAKAPPEVIETERGRRDEAAGSRERLSEALERLSNAL